MNSFNSFQRYRTETGAHVTIHQDAANPKWIQLNEPALSDDGKPRPPSYPIRLETTQQATTKPNKAKEQ